MLGLPSTFKPCWCCGLQTVTTGGSAGGSQLLPSMSSVIRRLGRALARTSAPMVPHFVHTMRGPNVGTVRSPARWSTFKSTSCRHCWHWTASDRTPSSPVLESIIGSIGSLKHLVGCWATMDKAARGAAGLATSIDFGFVDSFINWSRRGRGLGTERVPCIAMTFHHRACPASCSPVHIADNRW
jgi:hypothetical protein